MNHTPTLLNDAISGGFWMECDCGWSSFTDDDPGVVVTEFDSHVDERLDDCDPHGIPRLYLGSHLCAVCGERFHPTLDTDTTCSLCDPTTILETTNTEAYTS